MPKTVDNQKAGIIAPIPAAPEAISRNYYRFAAAFTKTDFEDDKLLGKFYTDFDVCASIAKSIGRLYHASLFATEIKVIDPFCGDGRLVLSLLTELIGKAEFQTMLFHIELWDIDSEAVDVAKISIARFCEQHMVKHRIVTRVSDAFVDYRGYRGVFDICVTNPPWGLLKPQKLFSKNNSDEDLERYRDALERYDSFMREEFPLSQPNSRFGKWGTNLARCGTEVAVRLINRSGICGIVSPASLVNDQVSGRLRKWLFEDYRVVCIDYYPAELKLYGSADISSITMVIQGGETDQSLDVRMFTSKTDFEYKKIEKAVFDYIRKKGYLIPLKTGIAAIPIMMYLELLPTTFDYCQETGLCITRELDETRVGEKLVEEGRVEFAKGYMVDRYSFHGEGYFLNEDKVVPPASVNLDKLVWRDVSRDSQVRRIKATLLPQGFICGNSLGVITCPKEHIGHLKMLLAIMNSMVFEYQARSMLVSNHVSAGIIKQIHVPAPSIDEDIINLIDRQLAGEHMEVELEIAAARLYSVSLEDYCTIVDSFEIEDKTKAYLKQQYAELVNRNENGEHKMIYNHYASTLSDLDMQIIRCVPPGGNWKNIPESVPSHRLEQIRESYQAGKGSRSTYYGRLRPEMPSYTINTYFNRPGNGCHMHYEQDRTLSQREAARFQSFPDSFEFIGSLGAINNQIGNAVPPLLAYQIAKAIPFKGQFIDLFCGAGGLALGFVWAGWKPIVGNDIDRYAIETHKRNLAGDAIVGDINSEEVFYEITEKAKAARAEAPELPLFVLGGPPCQGFSTANTRRGADDMRNWLFKSYVRIVKAINPDGFVFENVRGILNLDRGRFFDMIKRELEESVQEIKVNQISAANFGVPQRRDRVVILGGSSALVRGFSMTEITCVPKDQQISLLPSVIGVEDAIGDLPPLSPGEDGSKMNYRFPPANPYQAFMRGEITADDYLKSYHM